jgi:hypothetical protein
LGGVGEVVELFYEDFPVVIAARVELKQKFSFLYGRVEKKMFLFLR